MVVDLGYLGATLSDQVLIPIKCPATPEQRVWSNLISSARIDVERVIAYFKRFRILRHIPEEVGGPSARLPFTRPLDQHQDAKGPNSQKTM